MICGGGRVNRSREKQPEFGLRVRVEDVDWVLRGVKRRNEAAIVVQETGWSTIIAAKAETRSFHNKIA